jgi:ribosome-binding ATPase YchF (GTP1/OBG family)
VLQKAAFERAKDLLEKGTSLRTQTWNKIEREALSPLFLITMKPVLYVANVGDDDMEGKSALAEVVRAHAKATGAEMIPLCGDLEGELMAMPKEDRAAFLADLGMKEPGLNRLIRKVYDLLGLQSFFTAGPIEIRAWTIHKGDPAPVAAGVIHTDFEKHFIRAEVYSIEDLVQYKSEAAVKAAGKLRVEGREYAMREGDLVHFLIGK